MSCSSATVHNAAMLVMLMLVCCAAPSAMGRLVSDSCSDVVTSRLRVIGENCHLSSVGDFSFSVWCHNQGSKTIQEEFKLSLLEPAPGDVGESTTTPTTTTICIGLVHVYKLIRKVQPSRTNAMYQLYMNSSRPVGVAVRNNTCWEQIKQSIPRGHGDNTFCSSSDSEHTIDYSVCLLELSLLEELLVLPMFDEYIESPSFWNFSSPWFEPRYGWMQKMVLGFVRLEEDWWSSLANTSLQTLEVFNGRFISEDSGYLLRRTAMPELKILSITEGNIKGCEKDFFLGVPLLEELDLSNNNLYRVPSGISAVQRLRTLNLSRNKFNNIPDFSAINTLPSLPMLEYLNLAQTNMPYIFINFPRLPKLRYLVLSGCGLLWFYNYSFTKLLALEILDLSNNLLTTIPDTLPHHLHTLDLHGNNLEDEYLTFDGNIVTILNLSHNHLKVWPKLTNVRIESLDLSHNDLTRSSNIIDIQNVTVMSLNLSKNSIIDWKSDDTFSWVIRDLDVSFNKIIYMTATMCVALRQTGVVDLRGNPFHCSDCNTQNLQRWLQRTEVNRRTVAGPLLCYTPAELQGKPLETVHLEAECVLYVLIPLASALVPLALLVLVGLVVRHRYRFEVAYISHLLRIRMEGGSGGYEGCIYDAFICYSGVDRPWVLRQLAPGLEGGEERYRLCLHDRDFLLGTLIPRNIVRAIDRSRKTVLVLSQTFVDSKWCQWETDMANHRMFEESRNFLILLQREPLKRRTLPRHLKLLMDTRTYLEWGRDTDAGEALVRLKTALGPSLFQRTGRTHNSPL